VLTLAGPSHAVLGLFENDPKEAPNSAEMTEQEAKASKLFEDGRAAQEKNKLSTARDLYEDVVYKYPLTNAAANSQFEIGRVREKEGDPIKAFEAYQLFVDKYKQSDLFAEAIQRQFELATLAMNGKTGSFFLVLPAKTQTSKVVEMFEKVAANAPRSKYAPLALYNVGLLETKAGKPENAIVAYERVAEDYKGDPKAAEARKRMIEIYESRETRNDAVTDKMREQIEELDRLYSDDPEIAEYRVKSGQLQERDAEKSFNIGRYYEKKGNLRAAAIYYMDVPAGSARHGDAAARLAALQSQDPNLVLPLQGVKRKVEAPVNVLSNPNYVGPARPNLQSEAKPQMRTSEVDVLPIPAGEKPDNGS